MKGSCATHLKSAAALLVMLASRGADAYQIQRPGIPSQVMRSTPQAVVVLPDAYAQSERRFPVVYVLHGWSGNQDDWVARTDIEVMADLYDVILVMPDGGYDKWYIDSVVDPDVRYQTYIGKEVIDFIDKSYRTRKEKYGRAITGLSMGGFGALNVAVNNQATIGMVGSISGGVDPRDFAKNWGLEAVFGDKDEHKEFWDEKAIINNAHQFIFSGMDLTIDCGIDDFFINSNRALHAKLLEMKVPHDYTERPGGHTWDYWNNAIKYQILFFSQKMAERLPERGP